MQTITYTDEQRATLFDAGWKGTGKGAAIQRAPKMVRPTCRTCQIGGDELVGWWDDCEHDPYWNLQPKTMRIPKYMEDEDGDMVLDEEATKAASRTKFIRLPDIVEVAYKHHAMEGEPGRALVRFRNHKGFRSPAEVGIAPLCEAMGCGKSWPTIRTDGGYGDYCSIRHAKLCVAHATSTFLTIVVEQNAGIDGGRLQRKELQDVQI